MQRVDQRTVGLLAVILMLGAFFGFAGGRTVGDGSKDAISDIDSRRLIELTPQQQQVVVAGMRRDLEALQAIQAGLAANDLPSIARLAERRGSEANPLTGQLANRLGADWQTKNRILREGFDQIAADARAGQPVETILAGSAAMMNGCVACHQSYHIAPTKTY